MSTHRPVKQPDDVLLGTGLQLDGASLADFWRWAFGDLCDDDLKGIFAEWLVIKLLGQNNARRVSWANSDIITAEAVRLEVKSTSYWQSWKLIDEFGQPFKALRHKPADASRIRFGGLRARDATGQVKGMQTKQLKSELYVFAFQHETDPQRWDAMDLSQWEFYLFEAVELSSFCGDSVTLAQLRLRQSPMDAAAFATRARAILAQFASQKLLAKQRRLTDRPLEPALNEG